MGKLLSPSNLSEKIQKIGLYRKYYIGNESVWLMSAKGKEIDDLEKNQGN